MNLVPRQVSLFLSSPLSDSDPSLGTVRDVLFKKHPDLSPVFPAHCLLTETPPSDHPFVVSMKTCVSQLRVLQGNCVEATWIQLELRH